MLAGSISVTAAHHLVAYSNPEKLTLLSIPRFRDSLINRRSRAEHFKDLHMYSFAQAIDYQAEKTTRYDSGTFE